MSKFKEMIKAQGIKIKSEDETKKHIFATAKQLGCEIEARSLYNKYEQIAKKIINEKDRSALAGMLAKELYDLFGCYDGLSVDGVDLIPADEEYKKGLKNYQPENYKIKKM